MTLMEITFVAGGLGIPGLYVVEDPGGVNEDAKKGMLKLRIGKGWSKSLHFHTGQAPVLQYNRQLMQAILHDRLPIAKIVNATVIPLDRRRRATGLRQGGGEEICAEPEWTDQESCIGLSGDKVPTAEGPRSLAGAFAVFAVAAPLKAGR